MSRLYERAALEAQLGRLQARQLPVDDPAVHFRLKHGEHVTVNLRLIGDQRAGRMQNPWVYLPTLARNQAIGAGMREEHRRLGAPSACDGARI